MPLHVGIGLEDLAQPALLDRFLQEDARIIEPVLAYHPECDSGRPSNIEHAPGRSRFVEIGF